MPSKTILCKASLEFERPMDGSMVMSASSWNSPEDEASTRSREGASAAPDAGVSGCYDALQTELNDEEAVRVCDFE